MNNYIYVDGFQFAANPSPIGGGFTLVDAEGRLLDRQIIEKPGLTCNEVELRGIIRAIELAPNGAVIATDSLVVLMWIRRGWATTRSDLSGIALSAKAASQRKKLQLVYVPRKRNVAGQYNKSNRPANPSRRSP